MNTIGGADTTVGAGTTAEQRVMREIGHIQGMAGHIISRIVTSRHVSISHEKTVAKLMIVL